MIWVLTRVARDARRLLKIIFVKICILYIGGGQCASYGICMIYIIHVVLIKVISVFWWVRRINRRSTLNIINQNCADCRSIQLIININRLLESIFNNNMQYGCDLSSVKIIVLKLYLPYYNIGSLFVIPKYWKWLCRKLFRNILKTSWWWYYYFFKYFKNT